MDKNQLLIALKIWFKENENNKQIWCRDPIGKLIKEKLLLMENFKNKPRGNPVKAKAASDSAKAKKQGLIINKIENMDW